MSREANFYQRFEIVQCVQLLKRWSLANVIKEHVSSRSW